ncbi:hypothetical protein RHGRI_028663 [Rhododendron griersonianum]|uniref:Beta-glucosidase n=1 Tax=Rhododendron griersonianum TaxID=479676 RepID=A0AAV6IGK1_9ERIC|nr:hypothetical protein RHGRI_028663 [Rhododendron griersonianum]
MLTSLTILQAGSNWLYVYPKGIQNLLLYIKNKYNSPRIYITENGFDQMDDLTRPIPIKEAMNDTLRIKYYHDHLSNILEAMKAGVKVEGYFAWSLVDNFEWAFGYSSRFGMYYTYYKDGLKRYPKPSTHWFTSFLNEGPMLV